MKIKSGLLFILMISAFLMANAQGGGMRRTPEERTKRVVDTLTTVLKLDNTKAAEVQAILLDYNQQSDKLRASMQGGGGDRSAYQKLNADRDEKLKKALTEEQFKKFKDEIEPAMRPRRAPQNQ